MNKGLLSRYRLRNSLVAGALALVGALLVLFYVVSYRNDVERGAGLVSVIVAARDIPEGTDGAAVVGGGYLKRETVLRRNVVAGAIASPNRVSDLAVGQTIFAGQQVTVKQFRSVEEQGVLAKIRGNLRAMTVPGDPFQLLSGTVNDGDHVDVLANIKYKITPPSAAAEGGDLDRVATRIILRNLLVLTAPTSSNGGVLDSSGTDSSSITLALTDSQAQKLFFAMNNGDWWLSLRPVAKPSDSPETVQTIQSILGDGLGNKQLDQLTGGYGGGSISSGG